MKKLWIAIVAGGLILAGCSDSETEEIATEEEPRVEEVDSTEYVEHGTSMTAGIEQEEGVRGAQVFIDGDTAVGSLMVEESVEEDRIEQLAEKFAEEIKATHEEKIVNIQVVQGDQLKLDLTVE
ncbi:hypothetical protein [Bacillus sp. FJAT-45037]|uniref:hypothetical protein n=1 Tax=Bacillus sp. FJAT-45037 TaxID=2011007 RepID=UPI000C23193C|nr:hypothetical protein [Bacillus sp. FJAT-45037]